MLSTGLFCVNLPPKRQQGRQILRLEEQVSTAGLGGGEQLQRGMNPLPVAKVQRERPPACSPQSGLSGCLEGVPPEVGGGRAG